MAADEKKADIWMPIWIGSYLADTLELTTVQHGAYFLLLLAYWRKRGPLVDNDDSLRSITKLERSDWRRHRPVLSGFFKVGDGVWWHKRVEEELAKADGSLRKAANGGSKRWGSEDDSAARGRELRSKRLSEARQKGTHTAEEWGLMKAFHGCCVRCGSVEELVKDHITPIYQGGSDGIENLQPLCRSCNASKGPEGIDYRKKGWADAIAEGIKRLRDAFSPPSPPPSEDIGPDGPRASAEPLACPVEEVIALYHEAMPENPRVKIVGAGRRGAIKARWREAARLECKPFGYDTRADGLSAWQAFFETCNDSDFMTGKAEPLPGKPPFFADIDWIMNPQNFAKILENKYHRRAA